MKKGKPCSGNYTNFGWNTTIVEEKGNIDIKVVANPINEICNSCDHFKKCCEFVILSTKDKYIDICANIKNLDDKKIIH